MGTRTRKVPLFAYTPVCWTVNGHLYWVGLEVLRCAPGRTVSLSPSIASGDVAVFGTGRPDEWASVSAEP